MLYFFYGTDTEKARAHARAVIAVMQKKRPDAQYFRVTSENWNTASFEELVGSQGLFEQKIIVFADGIFEIKEAKEFMLAHASELAESENAFVFLEKSADAASVKKISKAAREVKEFASAETRSKRALGEFNVFSLADALGNRDKKEMWVKLSEALMSGASGEEISGVLFWQVKAMLAAREASSASAAGLSPFVFSKSKRYATKYSFNDLAQLSRSILSSYHDAHRGLTDLSVSLERLALKL